MKQPILKMTNITKTFPGVKALTNVNFDLYAGEVHALLGENGAGKSTLINIIGGIYSKDSGDIYINGNKVEFNSVLTAQEQGISIIHQELVLVPYLTVAENIFINREPVKKSGLVDYTKMFQEAGRMLREFKLDIDPRAVVNSLTIAQQQMVEIVKAVSFQPKVLIMDEPTSSISDKEVDALFECIHDLKTREIGIIYISHRMAELDAIADRVTVLRDGEAVATRSVKETNKDELIALMVGREMKNYYVRTYNECKEVAMKVSGLCSSKVRNISFELHKGEILGFSGLIGAGRSECMKALFGIDKITAGQIEIDGHAVKIRHPWEAIEYGMAFVPEDRRAEGIMGRLSIRHNISLKVIKEFQKGIVLNKRKENEIVDYYAKKLRIKAPDYDTYLFQLSGGNQQKVIFASWLAAKPKILILDEPTRGIDVGAKADIYEIINTLAREGTAIIMISSELPEIINMSDRVIVMRSGEISGILGKDELTQEKIMYYSVN